MSFFLTTPTAIDLGVNIDHVATLRNARGTTYPDPIRAALAAEEAGADAITLHLREDRRHIVDADVRKLRPLLKTRMNLECAVTAEMLDIACDVRPHDACLVPEKREELTTEGGLDVAGRFEAVRAACKQLADAGVRVSLFIEASGPQIEMAQALYEKPNTHTRAWEYWVTRLARRGEMPPAPRAGKAAKPAAASNSTAARKPAAAKKKATTSAAKRKAAVTPKKPKGRKR